MTRFLRFSCKKFCCAVIVTDSIITKTAPILKKFKGQNINRLLHWFNINFPEGNIKEIK